MVQFLSNLVWVVPRPWSSVHRYVVRIPGKVVEHGLDAVVGIVYISQSTEDVTRTSDQCVIYL